jgi:hypothetical protein
VWAAIAALTGTDENLRRKDVDDIVDPQVETAGNVGCELQRDGYHTCHLMTSIEESGR